MGITNDGDLRWSGIMPWLRLCHEGKIKLSDLEWLNFGELSYVAENAVKIVECLSNTP